MTLSKRAALPFALMIAACPATPFAAGAQLVRAYAGNSVVKGPSQIEYAYVSQLRSLRSTMIRQRQSDGGTLTAEHAASFQKSLDAINTTHDRTLYNNDPMAVDAGGHPVRSVDIHQNWTYSPPVLTGVVP